MDPSTDGIRFRKATAADRPSLVPLINSAFAIEGFFEGTRTDDERIAAMMEKGTFLLAEDASGQALATVFLELRESRGYMGMLAVDPRHQASGLGRRMLTAAEVHFRAQGCEAIDITVLSLRPELPPIYRRFGFVETGTEELHHTQSLKDGLECHFIVMSKPL
jgi:ribosomal protein S18 acetylase RimI-like enzyme